MSNFNDFLQTIANNEKKTRWTTVKIKDMRIGDNATIFVDEILPYDESAVNSICDRADVSGGAIHRVPYEIFKKHLNVYFNVATKSNSIVNIFNEKVYACHSGTYKILPINELVDTLIEYLRENHPNCELIRWDCTPTYTFADFALNDDAINEQYSYALNQTIGLGSAIYPVLRFITSNTGWSGANLIPIIYCNKAPLVVNEPIILKHEGKANIEKFTENCKQTFSLMLNGAEKLNELAHIILEYPANCAANIAQDIKLPKKITLPVIYEMEEEFGNASATAREVYLYLSKITESVGDNTLKQYKLVDMVSRALTLDFKKYDRSTAKWLEDGGNMYYQNFNTAFPISA